MTIPYLVPYATELWIYVPFFLIAFLLYYFWPTSVWRRRLIECMALANGIGAAFVIIIGAVILKTVQPDLVTIASVVIVIIDAFYTGKFQSQKPTIKRGRRPKQAV